MAKNSQIQWTDHTWNIAVGCTKVDADCKFCYMYRDSLNDSRYDPKVVRKTKQVFKLPLTIKETRSQVWGGAPLVFTSSLTDVFHPECDAFREEMWEIIRRCPHLTFQLLTKRPERIADHLPADWGDGWDNVWLGTSVGSPAGFGRIGHLTNSKVKAKVKFLSLEPLHQPITLTWHKGSQFQPRASALDGIDWVIVGGESGNENGKSRYRPCEFDWLEKIVEDCKEAGVPVFVKQLGTYLAKRHGLGDRHGSLIEHWPPGLQVREFPRKEVENV